MMYSIGLSVSDIAKNLWECRSVMKWKNCDFENKGTASVVLLHFHIRNMSPPFSLELDKRNVL